MLLTCCHNFFQLQLKLKSDHVKRMDGGDWKYGLEKGLNFPDFRKLLITDPQSALSVLVWMHQKSGLAIAQFNALVGQLWDRKLPGLLPQLSADGQQILFVQTLAIPSVEGTPVLRIVTLNMAFNVMANQVSGSEAIQVQLCQQAYPDGGFQCTRNAIRFLSTYHIFGLQEVNGHHKSEFQASLRAQNPSAKYTFLETRYRTNAFLIIGFDENVTGPGIKIAEGLLPLSKSPNNDYRPLQTVHFPALNLLVINLHAPHRIELKKEIEGFLSGSFSKFQSLDLQQLKIMVMGDFNDDRGALLQTGLDILGKKILVSGSAMILSCCADSSYQFPGDYVMIDSNLQKGVVRYGHPEGYIRNQPLMSDHDPIELLLALSSHEVSALRQMKPLPSGEKKIRFMAYNMLVAHPGYEADMTTIESKYKNWAHPSSIRKNLLLNAIRGQDLLALTEVNPEMLKFLMAATHAVVYCQRAYDDWGSAIVFSKDRFSLIDKLCTPIFNGQTQVVNSVLLLDVLIEKPLCVTVLHLKAGYEDQELRREKEMHQALRLTGDWMVQFGLNLNDIAHVVAGDLNSDRLAYPSRVRTLMLASGYKDVFAGYKNDQFWTYNYWQRSIFDYIFVRGPVGAADLLIPVANERSPNASQGSDHIPISCTLTLL
jgi:hypothetical protein